MQRIGFFSIRGFWMTPLAIFVSIHWHRAQIRRRNKGNDEECRLCICRGVILGLVMAARRPN
jgi:hypothetical protein